MSEKQAKCTRQLEAKHTNLQKRMDDLDRRVDTWDAAVTAVHTQDLLDTAAQRNAERRLVRHVQHTADTWRRTAYAALIASIVVEILAILTVHAQSVEIDPPAGATAHQTDQALPGDDVPATTVCCITADEIPTVHTLQDVTVTHYDCCVECCGKTDGITASGAPAVPYYTVAVDPQVIPLGSDVLVDYGDGVLHTYHASDTGSGIKGNRIDLCVSSHEEALHAGVKSATVYWVPADV